MVAPRGSIACERFAGGSGSDRPRERQISSSRATIASFRSSSTPSAPATAAMVTSSLVGPSPPVVITPSARPRASRIAPVIASGSSPTVVRRGNSTPSSASSRPRKAEFVSIVKPSRSSSPMVISSTRMSPRRGGLSGENVGVAAHVQRERIHGEDHRAGHRDESHHPVEQSERVPGRPAPLRFGRERGSEQPEVRGSDPRRLESHLPLGRPDRRDDHTPPGRGGPEQRHEQLASEHRRENPPGQPDRSEERL